jgi:hypothetical protein
MRVRDGVAETGLTAGELAVGGHGFPSMGVIEGANDTAKMKTKTIVV